MLVDGVLVSVAEPRHGVSFLTVIVVPKAELNRTRLKVIHLFITLHCINLFVVEDFNGNRGLLDPHSIDGVFAG